MAMTVSRDNRAAQLTSFIGREAELRTLGDLLADPACRLATILGPGGIGKTRLAVEVAAQSQAVFPDGVAFVPLQGETPPYETRCLWRSGDDSAALAAFLDAVRGFAPAAESAS